MSTLKTFPNRKCCQIPGRLDGKMVLVTEASMGCGLELTGELARRGAKVIMACRHLEKGLEAKENLIKRYGMLSQDAWKVTPAGPGIQPYLTPIKYAQLIVEILNLASFDSIRAFALKMIHTYQQIHVLVSNAEIMPSSYMETDDGFEMQIGLNYLGPFLLIHLIKPLLIREPLSRLIMVASNLYKQSEICWENVNIQGSGYTPFKAYSQPKLAIMLYVQELAKQFDRTGITPMAVHLGSVKNDLTKSNSDLNSFVRAFGITSWEGAQTLLHCCLIEDPVVGGFYENCRLNYITDKVNDKDARRLWNLSASLVGIDQMA